MSVVSLFSFKSKSDNFYGDLTYTICKSIDVQTLVVVPLLFLVIVVRRFQVEEATRHAH